MNIRNAELSVISTGCRDKGRPEFFRIGLPYSNRCKHPRLTYYGHAGAVD
jgi:hypothetical protein